MSVITLLEKARSYIALTDRAGATVVLRQAHGILQQRPELGLLGAQAGELNARLESSVTILPAAPRSPAPSSDWSRSSRRI